MSSIIEGYNYDIFISYRQKDNKGDRWVSEFVEALKTELESTFKEEISVYFDINLHDGLLETHDVDESLKEKLKCLIFIPIISRTYCDPKSFAWEHEFKSFVEQACQDQFGLKVRLPNGNVANRLIPVQIHDLYPEDKSLIEKELGGVLRAIEFIYKEPGVNKPLTAIDNEKKNLNNTTYRIQINKVANAIDEIIHGLRGVQTSAKVRKLAYEQSFPDSKEQDKSKELTGISNANQRSKKWLTILLLTALCIVGAIAIFKNVEGRKKDIDITKLEKSIAVLPFVNDSPGQENTYFINGIMEEVLNNLQKIKDFRVLSRTSTEQYRGSNKPSIPRIAKELDVNYIVEGSGQKYGNKFVLRVQLIAANNERHLWAESYKKDIMETSDIINIQSQIAQLIATELKVLITPDEKQLIEKPYTTNLSAYDLFLQARNEHMKYWMGNSNIDGLNKAMNLYRQSLQYDSTYAHAYSGLALGYVNKNSAQTDLKTNFVDSMIIYANKALSFNDRLDEAYFVKGAYYDITGDYKRALKEYNESIKINPNFSWAYFSRGWLHFQKTFDIFSAFDDNFKAIRLEHGPLRSGMMRSLGYAFDIFGLIKNARYYYEEALKLDNDSISYLNSLAFSELYLNDHVSLDLYYKVLKRDPSNLTALWGSLECYERLGRYEDAYNTAINILKIWKEIGYSPQEGWGQIGYAFWKTGHLKEAKYYFDKQIDIIQRILDLDPNDKNITMSLADVYAVLGEKEKVLYQVLDINDPSHNDWQKNESHIASVIYLYSLKYDPMLENLRSDPSFQKFVSNNENSYNITHERFKNWLKKKGMLKE